MHQAFFIILALLQFVIFFILLLGKLFLRHPHAAAPAYSTNNWDKALIIASILSIGIVADLFIISLKENDTQSASNSSVATGTINNNFHRSRDSLLARYGYQIDSAKNGIAGVFKDSLKTNTLIIKENEPAIRLDNTTGLTIDSVKNNTCFLKLLFVNGMAATANIQIKTVFAVLTEGNLIVPSPPGNNYYSLPFGSSFAANGQLSLTVVIPYNNTPLIYCLLSGTFSNTAATKTYSIRQIYCFDMAAKQSVPTEGAHFKLLDNFYHSKGF